MDRYPAEHQPTLTNVVMAMRAAQRAGTFTLHPIDVSLVLAVASEEYAEGYKRVPRFTPVQLCLRIGVSKQDTLSAARKRAVAAGWLHFEHLGPHPGLYWVMIPAPFHEEQAHPFRGDITAERVRSTGTPNGETPAERTRAADPPNGDTQAISPPNGYAERGDTRETGTLGGDSPEGKRDEEQQQPLQRLLREGVRGEGTATIAATSVMAVLATIDDAAVRARMTPLAAVALGLRPDEVAADLVGWISAIDGLSAEEVSCVLAIRHRHRPVVQGQPVPFRFPSHFTQLRARFDDSKRDLADRLRADRERAAIEAKRAAVAAAAAAPPAPAATELLAPWRRALDELRPPSPAAQKDFAIWLDRPEVYPLALEGHALVLHVPTFTYPTTIANRYAGDLAAAMSEQLGKPVRSVRCQINGYRHPAASAAPTIAIGAAS